jgi:hypothetical protein
LFHFIEISFKFSFTFNFLFYLQGRLELLNYTIDSIDSVARLQFLATGEYKAVAQFIDMDRDKIVFEMEVVNYYKGASLTQT